MPRGVWSNILMKYDRLRKIACHLQKRQVYFSQSSKGLSISFFLIGSEKKSARFQSKNSAKVHSKNLCQKRNTSHKQAPVNSLSKSFYLFCALLVMLSAYSSVQEMEKQMENAALNDENQVSFLFSLNFLVCHFSKKNKKSKTRPK